MCGRGGYIVYFKSVKYRYVGKVPMQVTNMSIAPHCQDSIGAKLGHHVIPFGSLPIVVQSSVGGASSKKKNPQFVPT
jgi:hypothetical protein